MGNVQPEKEKTESFWSKVGFSFIDKAFIGGLVGIAAWVGTVWSDSFKAAWSLQEKDKILNARYDAFTRLAQQADRTLEGAAIILQPPRDPADPLAFDPWTSRIDGYRQQLASIRSGGVGGSWSVDDPGWDAEHLLSMLSNLIALRREYALWIPDELNRSLEGFIRAVEPSLQDELQRIAALKQTRQSNVELRNPPEAKHARWTEILRAHRLLIGDIRATFGLDRTFATPLSTKH